MALPPAGPDMTALVTGASSGIGVALARQLAMRGHGVTLVARRADRLNALAEELSSTYGVRAEALTCDLLDADARDALPRRIEKRGLTVNILINNAGIASSGEFAAQDINHEIDMLRLNCEAVLALTAAYAPAFTRRPGAILIVASAAGFHPIPRQATYAATKAFALSLAEALHTEMRAAGTSVTALCPGPVDTEIATNSASLRKLMSETPKFSRTSADRCAAQAIRALEKNKRIVVPNAAIRAATVFSRNTPHRLLFPVLERVYPA